MSSVSPVSSPLPRHDLKYEAVSQTNIIPSNENNIVREDPSSGWRPEWVKKGGRWIFFTVLLVLALYLVLYLYGRLKGRIATSNSGTDVVFRFGPVVLALIVSIMFSRLADDLAILQPYMALAEESAKLRKQPGARLTEPRTFGKEPLQWIRSKFREYRKLSKLAALWCTLVLVPLQTGLLTKLPVDSAPESSSFKVLELSELFHSAFRSEFPKSVIEAIYHGQGVTDFKWVGIMHDDDRPTEPGWAAIMPFHPSTGPQLSSGQNIHWRAKTSALWSSLDCVQLDDFEVTADTVSIDDGIYSADAVKLRLEMPDGCSQKFAWDHLSTERSMSRFNPLFSDGYFALWDNVCSDTTFALISGPLAAISSKDYTSTGNTDWGALSCRSDYIVNSDDIYYTVQSIGQGTPKWDKTPETQDINVTSASWDDGKTDHNLSIPIQVNVVNTTLLYEVSSPYQQRTFWGFQKNNTFQDYLQSPKSEFFCSESKPFIDDVLSWSNDRACGMYLMASDIWSLLVAATAASVALYVPDERYKDIEAEVQIKRSTWILTDFGFLYTVLLYLGALFLLMMDRSLPFGIGSRKKGHQTGLAGSPSSIAGLAAVFRDTECRKLVEGIDALNSEEATERQRDILGKAKLRLGRWKGHHGQPVAKPVDHVRLNTLGGTPDLVEDSKTFEKLRYNHHPVKWGWVLVMLIIAAGLIFVTLWFLIIHRQTSYHIWHQRPPTRLSFSLDTVGSQVQKVIFTSLPTIALAIICLFWAEIDNGVRRTEPYKGLKEPHGGKGSETVLLDYMHDWNVTIPFRAAKNQRWKLFYVTLISLFLKIATLFWAGIFEMDVGYLGGGPGHQLQQDWRPSGFLENSTTEFTTEVRNLAISQAVFGYPRIPGWQTESYIFPSVELTTGNYTVSLQGMKASMSCINVEVSTRKSGADSGWSTTLKEGECAGAIWPSACELPQVGIDEDSDSGTIEDGQCMAWRYLDAKDCPQIQDVDAGRWWIFGMSGSISAADHTFADLSPSPNHVSLLCTPRFYFDKVSLHMEVSSDSKLPTLSIVEPPTQHQELPFDRWKNGNRTFASYASELINETLAGSLQVISYTTYLDVVSSIAALNLTSSTDGLFNADALKSSASDTFGALIAAIVSIDQTDPSASTSPVRTLLSPVTTPTLIPANEQFQVAHVQVVPTWVGLIALCIFVASLSCAFFNKVRRTPNDTKYAANVLSLVYDSGLMYLVEQYPDNIEEIAAQRFALGAFTGMSGKRRLGIYVPAWSRGP